MSRVLFFLAVASAGLSLACAAAAEPASPAPSTFTPPDRSLFAEGRFVYERNCLVCHGDKGDGRGEVAPTLPIKPRSFRGGSFKYRSTPWGKLPTDDDLTRTIRHGISGTAMGAFTFLTPEETRAVIEYVKSLSRKWLKPENYAAALEIPPEPNWLRDPRELTAHAAEGRKLFVTICAPCHGEKGDGHGPAAPALKNDLGDPDEPADLRSPHLRSGDDLRDIYRVLMTGLNGTPMASFAEALTPAQKWDLIAYLQTLRVNSPAAAPQPPP
jgi:mono/diheme cytochrome c family protein